MITKKYLFFWISCYLLALLAAYQIQHIGFVAPDNVIVLEHANFVHADSNSTQELNQLEHDLRRLPDNWQWHNDKSELGHYLITFSATPKLNEVWGLLIPTIRSNVRVSLNGTLIGDGGSMGNSMEGPISSNLRRPMFFTISPALFNEQNNQLLIEVKSSVSGKGFLDKILVGPHSILEPAYQRHYFFRISLVESITYALIIMATLMTLLAVSRPKNSEYRWFALAVLLWAAHNSTNHISNVIWSNHFWDWFSYSTLGWFALVAPIVLLRFRERRHPKFERYLLFLSVLMPTILLMLPQTLMHQLADFVWYPIALSVGGGALVLVFIDAWKTRNIEFQLLATSGLFIIPYAFHDLLLVHAILPWEDGYYIQFGAIILLAVFAIILLSRLVKYNNEAEQLNNTLHDEVARKTAKIKQTMEYTQSLEKKEWLSAERARITRDMHDGVAGQIVSTISGLQKGNFSAAEIQRQLEYCINDLRLMIDSLDNEDNDLVALLGMFRYRVTPLLEHAAIQLTWQSLPMSAKIELTPSVSLHLLRILQEAVHNVIRHSQSDSISITAEMSKEHQDHVTISVRDKGIGLPASLHSQADESKAPTDAASQVQRGLKNMHFRAEQIGATLSVHSGKSGTETSLTLPVTILDN